MKKRKTELKKIGKRCLKNLSEERYHKMSEIVINVIHKLGGWIFKLEFWALHDYCNGKSINCTF